MPSAQIGSRTPPRPIRSWPAVVAVTLQWLAWIVLPLLVPQAGLYGFIGGVFGGGLAVLVWLLFFSRAAWSERLGALVLMPAALYATSFVVHQSISNGMMGMMLYIFSIPFLSLALAAGIFAHKASFAAMDEPSPPMK